MTRPQRSRPSIGGLLPGKLPVKLLAELLEAGNAVTPDVLLGPAIGEDACALRVAGGTLIAATDPVTLTTRDIGRFAVVINANDVAVMGVRPRWFLSVILVPPGSSPSLVRQVFTAMRQALDDIGAELVGGHTEVSSAVVQPVVIGQMIGFSESDRFVTTGGAQPGDVVVQVFPVPIEGAAVLASEAIDGLRGSPIDVVEAARRALEDPGLSVVEPALLAAELGANALHDPTEGGLAAALHELAAAAGVALRIDRKAILWFEPGRAVCEALGADPWATLASGSLLATFPGNGADAALAKLGAGYPVARIGTVVAGTGVTDDSSAPIPWPARDEVARILGG